MIRYNMKQKIQLRSLTVENENRLPELLDLLIGEHFVLTDIEYDAKSGLVKIPFWRVRHNGRSRLIRNWWFYRMREVDVVRAMLWVRHVVTFEQVGAMEMHTYSFTNVQYRSNSQLLIFSADPGLRFNLCLRDINIQACDLRIEGKCHVHEIPFFWEACDRMIYD